MGETHSLPPHVLILLPSPLYSGERGWGLAYLVEQALTAYLAGNSGPVADDSQARLEALEGRVEALEARLSQARPTPPQTAPTEGSYRTDGLLIAEALVAAGAPISRAQAEGSNRDRSMLAATGQTCREWLQSQGWTREGRRWYRRAT